VLRQARAGFDGLVHLAPFECVPEPALSGAEGVMAQNVLRQLQDDIPILSLSFDEQTARAGLVTRLEAFADLLHARAARQWG
jgi:predicted nucleotide-binding protein (sugar kinase/HSP70/actin superfamily)